MILASWGLAFFEYCLMVPANRWGNANWSATELKIIQKVITLVVFSVFAIITSQSGCCLNLRWPYQAKVMKTFEQVSSTMGARRDCMKEVMEQFVVSGQ